MSKNKTKKIIINFRIVLYIIFLWGASFLHGGLSYSIDLSRLSNYILFFFFELPSICLLINFYNEVRN